MIPTDSPHESQIIPVEKLLASLNRPLPHDADAESSVISCFLQDPINRIGEARHTLNASAFYLEDKRLVFTQLVEMYDASLPIDPIIVTNRLRDKGLLERVGGPAAITEIFSFVPSPAHYLHYKKILEDKYAARRNIEAHCRSLHLFLDPALPLPDAIEASQAHLDAVDNTTVRRLSRTSLREAIKQTVQEVEERQKRGGAIPGWTSGFPSIDLKCGGLQKGRVTVFAGLPSDGKSCIMQNCARNALRAGAKVGWYSLEMPTTEQTLRILCEDSGVDNGDLYNGLMSRAQQEMLARSVRQLSELGCDIVDTDNATAQDILADIEHGGYDVVVVDYLQLMEDSGRKGASREEIVASISRRMKQVAKRTGVHVLTASQLNDHGKLRESRAIGQDADAVFLVHKKINQDGTSDDSQRILFNDKNRGGKRHWQIPLLGPGSTFTFKEIQEEAPQ